MPKWIGTALLLGIALGVAGLVAPPTTDGAQPAATGSNLSACTAPVAPAPLENPTVITECTAATLQTALAAGGHITFACGPDPVTIPVNEPLVTSATTDIVLDGQGLVTLDGQGVTRILEKPFTPGAENDKTRGNDLTIQHMRFINGRAPAATSNRDGNARGGAITATSPGTRLIIINSTFENNTTTSINDEDNQGGAVYAANIFETVIVGSVFTNNTAGSGGGFGGIATGLRVYNSRFTGNAAADDRAGGIVRGHGGAIHLDGVTNSFNPDSNKVVTVCGSEFVGNTAVRGGGALKITISDNKGTKATYDRSLFRDNRLLGVPPTEGHGGAIYHIEDDFAGGTNEDNLEITASTFDGNVSSRQGGGVWLLIRGNGRIVNSTFTANAASEAGTNRIGQGGGAIISNGVYAVVNSTFANNFATFQGGAMFAGGSADVTLTNSLFSDNRLDPTHTNPVTSEFQGYHTNRPLNNGGNNLQFPRTKTPDFDNDINNLIVSDAAALLFADPLLQPLADNGGPTPTRALADDSPARAAANPATCPTTDQRGVARDGGACDIGAYEVGVLRPSLTSVTPALLPAGTDAPVTLTLTGSGFTADSVARWNGADRPTTYVTTTQLTMTVPPADLASPGTATITVFEPSAQASESAGLAVEIVTSIVQVWLPVTLR